MKLHHQKHHATYVTNLNVAEEKYNDAQAKSSNSLFCLIIHHSFLFFIDDLNTMIHLQPALRFNGGGHINHAIFWQVLCPKQGGNQPEGALAEQIKKDFGSFDKLVTQLSNASVGVQGSGWGWLGFNKQDQRLQIATCSNQDPLQATTGKKSKEKKKQIISDFSLGLVPIFGIDVWEHAYYLQYKNVRADYVKGIFQVANWKKADELLQKAKQ